MASWDFPASGPVEADLSLAAGTISVTATPAQAVTVSLEGERPGGGADKLIASSQVSFENGRLRVHVPGRTRLFSSTALALIVGLPEGSAVAAQTASADVACTGDFASLRAATASGDVQAGRVAGGTNVSTASGDVRIDQAGGDARISTASGDVLIDRADGKASVKTASGDVTLRQASGAVSVKTASGDVRLDRVEGTRADVTTVSGDITAAVPPGVGVYLDLASVTGQVSTDFEPRDGDAGAALTLQCRSVSGDVRAVRTDAGLAR